MTSSPADAQPQPSVPAACAVASSAQQASVPVGAGPPQHVEPAVAVTSTRGVGRVLHTPVSGPAAGTSAAQVCGAGCWRMTADARPLRARPAQVSDAAAIAGIYNQGIADRVATFETEPRSAEHIARWFDGGRPIVVVEDADGTVVAFASASAYRDRPCYAGIAEFSVYVRRDWRGRGVGRVALAALIEIAGAAGFWKLVSRVFPENFASRALLRRMGCREVGVYERHGRLDGVWRDCVIVERLLEPGVDGSGRAVGRRTPQ